jgi:hypothetical protein
MEQPAMKGDNMKHLIGLIELMVMGLVGMPMLLLLSLPYMAWHAFTKWPRTCIIVAFICFVSLSRAEARPTLDTYVKDFETIIGTEIDCQFQFTNLSMAAAKQGDRVLAYTHPFSNHASTKVACLP